jgi:TetR/AcrR family fatty acid metabolism transcriptional regulator
MNIHSIREDVGRSVVGKVSDKRESILRGAALAFAEKGFFESRISDVAKAAGVADGTIYLYFSNKNLLLKALFEDAIGLFISRAKEYLAQSEDPVEQLQHLFRLHFELLEQNPHHALVLQIELRQGLRNPERFSQEVLAEYLRLIKSVIEAGQRQGVFRRDVHPALVANMSFGILDELATKWVLAQSSYPLMRDLEQVMTFFFSGILESPALKKQKTENRK